MKLLTNILFLLIPSLSFGITDQQLKDYRSMAVRVVDTKEANSGGTGSIIQSSNRESIILTNKHVCGVIKQGGFISTPEKSYKVDEYKEYPYHDLCLIKIRADLEKTIAVAQRGPKAADRSYVTGHPRLLPNVVTEGHFSDTMSIQIVVDVRECTDKEFKSDPMTCMFMGYPIVENYDSQMTTNQIQAGNSGSAVLNSKGELSGVVFAGSGELSWAFIVPHSAVVHFLATQQFYRWKAPVRKQKEVETAKNTTKAKKACAQTLVYPNVRVENICKLLKRSTLM